MCKYGLIGEKLGHSFSKEIHEQIADYNYELIELTSDELRVFLEKKEFEAVNVTIPYKQEVIPYIDEMTEEAKTLGAVNCIKNIEGKLIGHNTDFDGLVALINHAKIDVADKKVLILGTGGTSDTAYGVCKELKAKEILKVSRNGYDGTISYEEAAMAHSDSQVIINTTPCGMYPNLLEQPLDLDGFNSLEGVVDAIYNPLRTSLISQALAKGIKAEGGLYMLATQAVKASEFFLGVSYSRETAEKVFSQLYKNKSNIVLTGMPASGKTTIGTDLAAKLDRAFYDTDLLAEKDQGMTISQMFEKYGEKYFRDIESKIIREVSTKSGAIIATGGGAILKKENVNAMKLNGQVFFIDRSPELLVPTDDRPRAYNKEEIKKRYEERYPTYISTADYIIKNQSSIEKATEEILEEFK